MGQRRLTDKGREAPRQQCWCGAPTIPDCPGEHRRAGTTMLSGRRVSRPDHDVRHRQWMVEDREAPRNRPMGGGSALCWRRASANGTIRLWESIYVQADKDLNGGCGADERATPLCD